MNINPHTCFDALGFVTEMTVFFVSGYCVGIWAMRRRGSR